MADASDGRRSGGAWWKWGLGIALVLLAVLLGNIFFTSENDTGEGAPGQPAQPSTVEEQPTEQRMPGGASGPIVSFVTITTSANQDVLVGREAQLSNLNVVSVAGGDTLYVSVEGRSERVLVVLDEATQIEAAGAEAGEQQPTLAEGQTISTLEGTVEALSAAQLRKRELAGTVGAGERVYILADRIAIDEAG